MRTESKGVIAMKPVKRIGKRQRRRAVDCVATFVALIHAHERGDRRESDEAHAELERLGVAVRFLPVDKKGHSND